jgi:hypothetical protein
VGAVIVVGCLAAAVVSVLGGLGRTAAVDDAGGRLAALTVDAADMYQALADADAAVTTGYVSGGREPAALRARYDDDLARAAGRAAHAAEQIGEGDAAAAPLNTIITQLPVYAGLMETARTYNRQGLPLGQSYLTSGSQLMRATILPAVGTLRGTDATALAAANRDGRAVPYALLLLGVALLAAITDLSVREHTRTHRTLNPGLVGAGAAVLAAVLWWLVAGVAAGNALADAGRLGDATSVLDDTRTAVLQARSNESLVLVARNGGSADQTFTDLLARVTGGDGGLLVRAQAGGLDVTAARAAALAWQQAHRQVRALDDGGQYQAAVAQAVGNGPDSSSTRFTALDDALTGLTADVRAGYTGSVRAAASAQTLLVAGPAVLLVLAGAAAAAGVAIRLREYR